MLSATEQLAWSATLDRFRRGYESLNVGTSGRSADEITWQLFSGNHLKCKVLSILPTEKPRVLQNTQILPTSPDSVNQPCQDRQLRIIVECGPNELEDAVLPRNECLGTAAEPSTGTACPLARSSQPRAPLVPVDVDLVRVNTVYFQTSRRLDAVQAFHQNTQVLIRYLDEHDASKAHRIQFTFTKEEDKKYFLALIEPDCMVRSVVVGLKVQKAENGTEKDQKRESIDSVADESPVIARESRAAEEAHLETQSQSLIDKLLQLAETRLRHSLPQPSIRCNIAASLGTHSSGEHSSPTGCSNCSRPVQHQQGNPKDGQEFCLLSSNNLESADVGPLETPPTIVTQDDLPESVDEEHEEGLHGWPDPSAVECIQDDVRRLCLTDPKLEWLIASCVEQHLHSIAHN